MAFIDYSNELGGQIEGLDPMLALKLINRAWHDIQESRLWSFNTGEAVLVAPAIVTGGSVTTVQFTNTIVANATAASLWQAMGMDVPITLRQFRVGGGPIYNITDFDGVNTITLDRVYTETSASGQAYSIYKCYYSVPSTNFFRWVSIFDPINSYPFVSLTATKDQLDRVDPQRQSFGNPYYASAYKPDSNQVIQYELWPHPTASIGYMTVYETRGNALVNPADALPPAICEEVLMSRALYHACHWKAQSDLSRGKTASANGWITMSREHNGEYHKQLLQSMRNDEEAVLKNYSTRRMPSGFPPINTGDYMASHDVGDQFY